MTIIKSNTIKTQMTILFSIFIANNKNTHFQITSIVLFESENKKEIYSSQTNKTTKHLQNYKNIHYKKYRIS